VRIQRGETRSALEIKKWHARKPAGRIKEKIRSY
jgi:hypothetical protein